MGSNSYTYILDRVFFKRATCFYLFHLWLLWVFVSMQGLSLVENGGSSFAGVHGFLIAWLLFLWSTWAQKLLAPGLYSKGPRVVVPGLGCSAACGIFLEIEVKVKVAQSLRL